MAETAGYNAVIKATGLATSMTNEACTEESGTVFQITDAAKRILNPAASFTVEVDTVAQSDTTYEIDFLFGRITFDSSQTGSTVTISGEYLPSHTLAEGTAVSMTTSRGDLDSTVFDNVAVNRTKGLKDFNATFSRLEVKNYPIDGDGGSESNIATILEGDDYLVFEAAPEGAGGVLHRAFVHLNEKSVDSSHDGLVAANLNFIGTQPDATDNHAVTSYGYE